MLNKHEELFIKKLIKQKYPTMNPQWNSARGKERHLRITQNGDLQKIRELLGSEIKIEHNTKYSSSYNTLYFKYNVLLFPMVISCGEMKLNKLDKIVTKTLTPQKLCIIGKFYSQDEIIIKATQSLNNLNISGRIKDTLILLMNKSKDLSISLSQEAINCYNENYKSINKDFGEILVGINLLNNVHSIEFPDKSNNSLYDLIIEHHDGEKEFVNIKSENGSGQSFKTIPFSYIKEAQLNKFYSIGSNYERYINMLEIFHSKMSGKNKHIETFNLLSNGDDLLAKILNDFKNFFYKENFNKLKGNKISFDNYIQSIINIFNNYNLKPIGIPIGTKDQKLENYIEENIENLLMFTLSSIVAKFHDELVFNKIIKKMLLNNVSNIIIKKNKENGFIVEKNNNPLYKIHYWANAKNPTNNLIGYKVL